MSRLKIAQYQLALEMARQNLTQAALARKLGIHTSSFYELIAPNKHVQPATAFCIASALNVPVERIVVKEKNK